MIYLSIFIGLWIGLYVSHDYIFFSLLSVLIFVFLLYRYKKKIATIFAIFLLTGFAVSFIRFDFDKEVYDGVVIQSKENYFLFSSSLEKFYVYEKDNTHEVGDVLSIKGEKKELDFTFIESGFDFNTYLNDKGVYAKLENVSIDIKFLTPMRMKNAKNHFLSSFEDENIPLVSSLLFGYGEDSYVKDKLEQYHLYRLFNAGGLFINAFLVLFTYLFKIKLDEKKARLCSFLILVPYFIIAIDKFAVFRIFFIQILLLINRHALKNYFSYIEVLSISGIILLLFSFHLAYQDGFILGYLMSLFIALVNNSFPFIKKKRRLLITPIFIFLFFVPFEIEYYHSISLLSPFIVSLLSPLFILINIFNLLCLYGLPLEFIPNFLLNGVNGFFSSFTINTIKIASGPLPIYVSFVYEMILVFIFYYLSIRCAPFYKPLIISFITLLSLIFVPFNRLIDKRVYFINVGQGDSTLIVNRNETILIDTGGNTYSDIAMECLIPFFYKEKIYKIDYLIITHEDYDHSGAKESLMNNFKVGDVLDNKNDFPFTVGDITIQNLNPYAFQLDRGENDASLVLDFHFLNKDFLIMGDASKSIENIILKNNPSLKTDILKVGHHGSNTSTSFNFIKTIKPKEAVISVGKNNKYKHPDEEVIAVLNYFDINIRRTDIEGTICYC